MHTLPPISYYSHCTVCFYRLYHTESIRVQSFLDIAQTRSCLVGPGPGSQESGVLIVGISESDDVGTEQAGVAARNSACPVLVRWKMGRMAERGAPGATWIPTRSGQPQALSVYPRVSASKFLRPSPAKLALALVSRPFSPTKSLASSDSPSRCS